MNRLLLLLSLHFLFLTASTFGQYQNLEAFHENVSYGSEERMKIDVWLAKSDKPTPLIVWFHGGAFKAGDKKSVRHGSFIQDCLNQKISVASCNYPYVAGGNYKKCYSDSVLAMQHILNNAKTWNINDREISTSGFSAGALLAQYLVCKNDKLSASGVFLQCISTDTQIHPILTKDTNPMFIFQNPPPSDRLHAPHFATDLKAECDKLGIVCELYGSSNNDIPNKLPTETNAHWTGKVEMIKFFKKVWLENDPRNIAYKEAEELLKASKFSQAYEAFKKLDDFKDSFKKVSGIESIYAKAFEEVTNLINEKDYYGANQLLMKLPKVYGKTLSQNCTITINELKENEIAVKAVKLRPRLIRAVSNYRLKNMTKQKLIDYLKKFPPIIPETKTALLAQQIIERLEK